MRARLPEKLELGRVQNYFGPDEGHNGRFIVEGPCGAKLQIIAENENDDWEHISVALTVNRRSPNWLEMCFAKDLFWDKEECVMQLHPPLSCYVKNHRYCLHLWKPKREAIPQPPSDLIGVVGVGPHETALWMNKMLPEMVANLKMAEQIG